MGKLVHIEVGHDQRRAVSFRLTPRSVSGGRHWFNGTIVKIDSRIDPALVAVIELALSELLTNALLHAQSQHCRILLSWSTSKITIGVADGAPQMTPVVTESDTDALGGRGIYLVDSLAQRWGYYVCKGGREKVVWAQFERFESAAEVSRAVPSHV